MISWVSQLLTIDRLVASGHGQRIEDQNLGLGWIYYALVRTYRPKTVVVIGSWRGFVPIVLARACADNLEGGKVLFIDPSLVDDFWRDPETVKTYFAAYGAGNIQHYCMTTQEFVKTDVYRNLGPVGLLFVDGYHTSDQAAFDHEAFANKLVGPALFHDAISTKISKLYDEPYRQSVPSYIQTLRERGFSVSVIPLSAGVAIVTPPESA